MKENAQALEAISRDTTEEIADVLESTAADRAACSFPDDSMRLLKESRDRAASAAAGGLEAAVP